MVKSADTTNPTGTAIKPTLSTKKKLTIERKANLPALQNKLSPSAPSGGNSRENLIITTKLNGMILLIIIFPRIWSLPLAFKAKGGVSFVISYSMYRSAAVVSGEYLKPGR